MNPKHELEKILPPRNGIKYDDEHDLIAKMGWNDALSASLDALSKRVATREEVENIIVPILIKYLRIPFENLHRQMIGTELMPLPKEGTMRKALATALDKKYILLRRKG